MEWCHGMTQKRGDAEDNKVPCSLPLFFSSFVTLEEIPTRNCNGKYHVKNNTESTRGGRAGSYLLLITYYQEIHLDYKCYILSNNLYQQQILIETDYPSSI